MSLRWAGSAEVSRRLSSSISEWQFSEWSTRNRLHYALSSIRFNIMAGTPARVSGVSKFLESLPDEVRERVELLRNVQAKCDVVKKEFLRESKALDEKYRNLFDPLFKERYQLIVGSANASHRPDDQEPGLVPGFWLKVLKSADLVGGNVTKRDEPILKYLLDISHGPLDDGKPGFKLVFKVMALTNVCLSE